MKKIVRTIILLTCICSMSKAWAQQADFSGSWQLNKAKSDFGQSDPDRAAAGKMNIKQQAGAITVEKVILSDGQDNSYSETFTFDGQPAKKVFTTATGSQARQTTVQWSQGKLLITANTTVVINGQEGIYTTGQAWTLSADGKTLTINNNTVLPDRKVVFTAVYDKL